MSMGPKVQTDSSVDHACEVACQNNPLNVTSTVFVITRDGVVTHWNNKQACLLGLCQLFGHLHKRRDFSLARVEHTVGVVHDEVAVSEGEPEGQVESYVVSQEGAVEEDLVIFRVVVMVTRHEDRRHLTQDLFCKYQELDVVDPISTVQVIGYVSTYYQQIKILLVLELPVGVVDGFETSLVGRTPVCQHHHVDLSVMVLGVNQVYFDPVSRPGCWVRLSDTVPAEDVVEQSFIVRYLVVEVAPLDVGGEEGHVCRCDYLLRAAADGQKSFCCEHSDE